MRRSQKMGRSQNKKNPKQAELKANQPEERRGPARAYAKRGMVSGSWVSYREETPLEEASCVAPRPDRTAGRDGTALQGNTAHGPQFSGPSCKEGAGHSNVPKGSRCCVP